MRFTITSAAVAAILAATSASAADTQVQVGNGGLTFTPNTVTAAVGDTVTFVYYPKNHTVTQSSFAAPCQPLAGGLDSGFQPVAAGAASVPSFTVTVNVTTPLWFYCKQSSHCESGMVFAINPSANKTFDQFQATAKASSADGTPPASSNSSGTPSGTTGSSTTGSSPSSTGSGAATSTTAAKNSALGSGVATSGVLAALGLVAGILF